MSAISSRPHDNMAQSLQIALDEQASDWELVLREIHHRMKNTLTLLSATVRRDFARGELKDLPLAVDRFERRVVAFGRLYQLLLLDENLPTMQAGAFFEDLCEALSEAVLKPAGIRCEVAIDDGPLSTSQGHRLALMLTELVTNAAKHAFPNKHEAIIRVEMIDDGDRWSVSVADNGTGAVGPLQGTGSRILEGLARSIHGRIHGASGPSGTCVTVIMPAVASQSSI